METKSSEDFNPSIRASKIAEGEKNDCVVVALANALEIPYDQAHALATEDMGRKPGKGTNSGVLKSAMQKYEDSGLFIGERKFNVVSLKQDMLLHKRNNKTSRKTISTFIKTVPSANYVIVVSEHALAIKDGVVIDAESLKDKTRRIVKDAYLVEEDPEYRAVVAEEVSGSIQYA